MATFQEVRDQAQQGNVGAIATLLTQSFSRQGVRVQAKTVQGTLVIRLQSSTPLEAQPTVTRIYRGLRSLQPAGIQRLQIIAQPNDNNTPLWRKSVYLSAPAESPTVPQSSPPLPVSASPPPAIPESSSLPSSSLPPSFLPATTRCSAQASPLRSNSRVRVGHRQPSGQWLPLWMEWVIANGLLTILLVFITPKQVRANQALVLGVLAAMPSAYVQTCILARRIPRVWDWGAFTLAGGIPGIGWVIQILGHWWVLRRTTDASRWLVAHLIYIVVMAIANVTVLGAAIYLLFDEGEGRNFLLLVQGLSLTGVTAWALETILAQVPERLSAPDSAPIPYLQAAFQRPFAPALPAAARPKPAPSPATAFTAPPPALTPTTKAFSEPEPPPPATDAFSKPPPPPATAAFSKPPPSPGQAATSSDGNISGHLPQQQVSASPGSGSTGHRLPRYQLNKQLHGFWWRWVMAGLKSVLRPLLLVMLLIFGIYLIDGAGLVITEEDVAILNGLIAGPFVLLSCLLFGDAQARLLKPYLQGWANLWRWTTFLGALIALTLTFVFPVASLQVPQAPGWSSNSGLNFTTLRFVEIFAPVIFVPLGGLLFSLLQFWPLRAAQQTRSQAWLWLLLNTVLSLPLVPLSWVGLSGLWAIGLRVGFVMLLYLPLSGLVMHHLVLKKG